MDAKRHERHLWRIPALYKNTIIIIIIMFHLRGPNYQKWTDINPELYVNTEAVWLL